MRGGRNKELRAGRTCGSGGCQVPELPIDPRSGADRRRGYGERPGRARSAPAADMVRRRRPRGARGGRVGAARGREDQCASAPGPVAQPCPSPPARAAPASVSGIV